MSDSERLFEITVTGALGPQFVQNIIHARGNGLDGKTPYEAANIMALGWVSDIQGPMHACLPDSYQASSVRVRQISDGGGPTYTKSSGVSGTTGSRTGDLSVFTVGPIVEFPVFTTKWVWGKIFLPGVTEPDISNGNLTNALITACVDLVSALLNWTTSAGDAWYVVYNRTTLTDERPTGGQVSKTIGTQRRRSRPSF